MRGGMTMATASSITLTHVPERFRDLPYEGQVLLDQLTTAIEGMRFHPHARQQIPHTFDPLRRALETCHGLTLQARWQDFEHRIWPRWLAGQDRPAGKWWTG